MELEGVHGGGLRVRVLGLALQLFVVPNDVFLHLLHLLYLLDLVQALQLAEVGVLLGGGQLEVLLGVQGVLVCHRILLQGSEVGRLRAQSIWGTHHLTSSCLRSILVRSLSFPYPAGSLALTALVIWIFSGIFLVA